MASTVKIASGHIGRRDGPLPPLEPIADFFCIVPRAVAVPAPHRAEGMSTT
jgi:hypothetical protein